MSTDNTIESLRQHLFETIAGVKAGTVDIDKARVVNDLSQTIVNTAKVEVDYLRAVDGASSGFMSSAQTRPAPPAQIPAPAGQAQIGNGITRITKHVLKDD